jgi:hypothetical protein
MVWLHAMEQGVQPPRATEDIDIVADVRAQSDAIPRMCSWLENRGFVLDGVSPDNIGHRYVLTEFDGPGRVLFDILAPEGIGERANLTTTPPARTLSARSAFSWGRRRRGRRVGVVRRGRGWRGCAGISWRLGALSEAMVRRAGRCAMGVRSGGRPGWRRGSRARVAPGVAVRRWCIPHSSVATGRARRRPGPWRVALGRYR